MIFQARLIFTCRNTLRSYSLIAFTRLKNLCYKVENVVHATKMAVGAIISAEFAVYGTRFKHTRERLVGYADAWIGFTIFK